MENKEEPRIKKLWELFLVFFKIGTFTIGGGYAMVPLIEKEIVDVKKWIEKEEFLDMLAMAQSSPGPIAVNVSVFVGYKTAGLLGSIIAVFGAIFMAFVTIILVAIGLSNIQDNIMVEKAFKAIRPAVVALIASPVLRMGKRAGIKGVGLLIPIIVVVLVALFNVNSAYIILVAAILGIMYGKWKKVEK